LLTLKPRLERRLLEVPAEEYLTHWRADYDALNIKRDELAVELSELYPPFATKIADLFRRVREFDAELSRLHEARPAGIPLLLGPELVARGLEQFTRNERSLVGEVQLPAFHQGQPCVWPPSRKVDWLAHA
jgi:hypothetical protein